MVLKCLAWIAELWNEMLISLSNNRNDDIRDLPDNVVFDILTRLPAESVFKCRRVCKHWLALTSSPHFAKMHLKRASPNLFVQSIVVPHSVDDLNSSTLTKCKISLFVYEDLHRMEGKFKKISGNTVKDDFYKSSVLVGCCDGTLVFRSATKYYVYNIVSHKKMIIKPPQPLVFFGISFHGIGGGYKLLFHGLRSPEDHQYHIFIYSSRRKTWREVTTFSHRPRNTNPNPVVLNDTSLYWISYAENGEDIPCCRNSVIMFKTDAENFHYMNHPGGQCSSLTQHRSNSLYEMDGLLCCCVRQDLTLISFYVLSEDRSWVWRYKVDLNLDEKKFPFYRPFYSQRIQFYLWKIQNGELIVYWQYRGLFRCHLQHNTVKRIDFPKLTSSDYYVCIACSSTNSVTSLMAGY